MRSTGEHAHGRVWRLAARIRGALGPLVAPAANGAARFGTPLSSHARRMRLALGPHAARLYTITFALIYLLSGIISIIEAGFTFAEHKVVRWFDGGLTINSVHESLHVVIGLWGLYAFWTRRDLIFCRGMAFIFGLLSVAGFLSQPAFGVIWLADTDLFLHGFTAILGETAARLTTSEEIARIETEVSALEGDKAEDHSLDPTQA